MQKEEGKKLGLWNIIGLGLGGAIGTGIFILLGFGIKFTGRSIMLVCMVGCFTMLLAYWYNLAMPMMFVLDGGDYSMKALLMNPVMTGFSAWMAIVNSLAMSGYALAIVDFMTVLWPNLAMYRSLVAVIIMTLFFITTMKGSRFVTILENWVTIILVISLSMFVIFGFPKVNFNTFFSSADGGFFRSGIPGFFSALAVMGWACQGTTMAPVSMTAVTDNPKRTIPKGIIIITLLLALVYGSMGIVAAGVLPFDKIAGKNISVTAEAILPHGLFLFFVVGGGIGAVASSMLGGLGMVRYPLMQIAQDGWLPTPFKKTLKNGYPYVTYGLFYILCILPLIFNMNVDAVVSLVMIPSMIINVYMNLACLALPNRYPDQWKKRSIKMPKWFFYICSILGAFFSGQVAYSLFRDLTPKNAVVAIIIVAVMFLASIIRIKQGAVKKEDLDKRKQEIYQLA